MIPGPDSCCVLLYGEIGEWADSVRSADIVRELMEASVTYKKIDVRINSQGGEVSAGIAIFNALRNTQGPYSMVSHRFCQFYFHGRRLTVTI